MNPRHALSCYQQALHQAKLPQVRPYIIGPALVSVLVITGGLYFTFDWVQSLTQSLDNWLPEWASWVTSIVGPLMYALSILVSAWSFGFIAMIVGSPFLGELSSKIENPQTTPQKWWQQLGQSLKREWRKLRYHLPRLAGLLLLGFVPVINLFAPLLWAGFGAWMMAVQFCDFSFENRGLPFEETLATLAQHRLGALTLGICTTLALSIPVLNFVVAPIATIAATLFAMSIAQQHSKEISIEHQ